MQFEICKQIYNGLAFAKTYKVVLTNPPSPTDNRILLSFAAP